jgi:hypothetical protein
MSRPPHWVLTLAVVAAVGCGGRTSGTGGRSNGIDGGGTVLAQVACDDFMSMGFTNCGGMTTAGMSSVQSGFGQACQNTVALPGSGVTPAALEACAAALNTLPCLAAPDMVGALLYGSASFLAACNFVGTLPEGAPCNEDFQCASALCSGAHQTLGTEGPLPPTCGTCAPTAAIGEPCSGGGCGPGAICSGASVCVAVTYGALGAKCDGGGSLCGPGLFCDTQAGQCVSIPANVGNPCNSSVGCAPPLVCRGSPATCQQPAVDGSCSADQDCSAGFVCETNTSPSQCQAITLLMPGEPCGAVATQCAVGSCPFASSGAPTCPTVVPDGQPCGGNATCDTYSACFNPKTPVSGTGVCTPIDGDVCR